MSSGVPPVEPVERVGAPKGSVQVLPAAAPCEEEGLVEVEEPRWEELVWEEAAEWANHRAAQETRAAAAERVGRPVSTVVLPQDWSRARL
jgi:hypothetical protein